MPYVLKAAVTLLKATIAFLVVALLGLACAAIVQLSSLPFLKAIDCAERGEGPFPFQKSICRQHVFWFRGTQVDIEFLQANRGAMNILSATSNRDTIAERSNMLYFLSARGLDLNAKENDQWTPLHLAIRNNDIETVTLLLRFHPNLDINAGPEDATALQYARALHRETIVRQLLTEEQAQKTILRTASQWNMPLLAFP